MRGRETFEHEFVQNKFKTIEMGIKRKCSYREEREEAEEENERT